MEFNNLKNEYETLQQKNNILQTQNFNNGKLLEESKNEINTMEEKYKNANQELNDYKNKNIELIRSNSKLEQKINDIQKQYSSKSELEVINDEIIESERGLIEEDSQIDDIKKVLEQKVVDLQGLSNLSNEDLKSKIISMKKVLDVLYKKLKYADSKKNECENKLIRLQNSFNEQLEEDKKELYRLYRRHKSVKKNLESSFFSTGGEILNLNFNDNKEKLNNNSMVLLYNENKSLKYVAKDLKKKIKELKKTK